MLSKTMIADCVFLGNATGYRECKSCQGNVRLKVFACQHPAHESTTIQECRKCKDYQSPQEYGFIREWSIGVTTAPRQKSTLEISLASLQAAGWTEIQLFAEPDTDVPTKFPGLTVSCRPVRMGAFPNWYLSLTEMMMRNPLADAYLLCQDDVLFSRGLRQYLEDCLWPAPEVGVVSIYCPSHYHSEKAGFHVINKGWDSWGALAYVFSNPSARAFLSHELALNHRHHGPAKGLRNIDSVVGSWCRDSGLPYFEHSPSLAQHIGETSTIWSKGSSRRRTASAFVSDTAELQP